MEREVKRCLRESLKRHGLSLRKQGLSAAVASIENLVAKCGTSVEVLDLAERLVNVIEDEGVDSCVVDEATVAAALKKFDGHGVAEAAGRPEEGREKVVTEGPNATDRGGRDDDKGGHFTLVDAFGKLRSSEGFRSSGSCSIGPGSMDEGLGNSSSSQQAKASAEDPCLAQPLGWDEVHGKFVKKSRTRCMLPPASSKVALFRERYFLLRRRVQRNANFLKPALENVTSGGQSLGGALARAGSQSWCELAEISALLGCVGEQKLILCLISTVDHDDARVVVEDLSGTVEVDLSSCHFAGEGYYAENMVVLIEGQMQSSLVFKASALIFPPLDEEAEETEAAGAGEDAAEQGDRIAFFSDLTLEDPDCLKKFSKALARLDSGGPTTPRLVILAGPFLSRPAENLACSAFASNAGDRLRSRLKDLAGLIKSDHPALAEAATFVLVPGPGDPTPLPRTLLPQPALLSCLTKDLEEDQGLKMAFASNPLRIRRGGVGGGEIVVFRDDLQAKLRRHDLREVRLRVLREREREEAAAGNEAMAVDDARKEDAGDGDGFRKACSTVLHQSHLAPLPSFSHPIVWDYDQSLWMTTQLDALVLCDGSGGVEGPRLERVKATECLNAGSFSSAGSFVVYDSRNRKAEAMSVSL